MTHYHLLRPEPFARGHQRCLKSYIRTLHRTLHTDAIYIARRDVVWPAAAIRRGSPARKARVTSAAATSGNTYMCERGVLSEFRATRARARFTGLTKGNVERTRAGVRCLGNRRATRQRSTVSTVSTYISVSFRSKYSRSVLFTHNRQALPVGCIAEYIKHDYIFVAFRIDITLHH